MLVWWRHQTHDTHTCMVKRWSIVQPLCFGFYLGLLLGLIHVILLGILFSGLLAQLLGVIRVLLFICNFSQYVQFWWIKKKSRLLFSSPNFFFSSSAPTSSFLFLTFPSIPPQILIVSHHSLTNKQNEACPRTAQKTGKQLSPFSLTHLTCCKLPQSSLSDPCINSPFFFYSHPSYTSSVILLLLPAAQSHPITHYKHLLTVIILPKTFKCYVQQRFKTFFMWNKSL